MSSGCPPTGCHETITTEPPMKTMLNRVALLFTLLAVQVVGAQPAVALEQEHVDLEELDTEPVEKTGWIPRLTLGAGVAFGHSSDVVGQLDGSSFTLTLSIVGEMDFYDKVHEWRNTLSISEGMTKTPAIEEFLKSSDKVELDSIYLYHIPAVTWLGPFARFNLQTALLEGFDVRAKESDYRGAVTVDGANSLQLTDSFKPLRLKESLGLFAQPIREEPYTLEIRVGGGARQVFADGQLVIKDDDATDEIEVGVLEDVSQIGAELAASLTGSLEGNRVSYGLVAEAMVPFVDSSKAADTKGAFERTNIEFGARASFKLVEWASLDYELKALREPSVIDEWQVTNSLLLTFGAVFE